jgi:hypothetical protein
MYVIYDDVGGDDDSHLDTPQFTTAIPRCWDCGRRPKKSGLYVAGPVRCQYCTVKDECLELGGTWLPRDREDALRRQREGEDLCRFI